MQLHLRRNPLRLTAAPAPRTGPPMFLFGIGAAKSGTTWLYRYLRAHPQCYLRGLKELHYFEKIEAREQKLQSDRLGQVIAQVEQDLAQANPGKRAALFADLLDIRDFRRVLQICDQDKNAYFRYMMSGLRQQRLVADITPDYINVSAEMLRTMVGVANETRFIYLMRDPVARLWSHARMDARDAVPEGVEFAGEARAILARAIAGQETTITAHSDYAGVLAKIEAAIPEEQRLVMFYEDLMTPAGLQKLCKFLGIKPIKADFERLANAGFAVEMADDERAAARRFLQPQYEAVASRFSVLPKVWQKSMAEGFA